MYVLHIANKLYSSWSSRPWCLMRELGIDFEERIAPFQSKSNWEQYRKFSPTGRVPCMHDGNTVVWDSLAIAEYLAERHPGVWPNDAAARTWARCASAEMHSGFGELRSRCAMQVSLRVRLHEVGATLQRDIDRIDELWSEGLHRFGGPFLAGSVFTAVDAFFAPVSFRVRTYDLKLSEAAASYAKRLLATNAVKAWESDALSEPWRDEAHEQDILKAGTVIADHRKAT